MKKIIFATLAAAALVACAKEEPIALNQEAIGFTNAFVDGSVRSVDPSITTTGEKGIKKFQVFGTTQGDWDGAEVVNIFNDVEVSGQVVALDGGGYSSVWDYQSAYVQYWINNNTYDFAAVVNGTVGTNGVGMPATITYTADGETDLLYAYNHYGVYTKGATPTAVPFTFYHLLSKVKFTVMNTIATNSVHQAYTYKVTGVKITNAYETGTYTVTYNNAGVENGTWGSQSDDFETEFGDIDTAADGVLVAATGAINGGKKAESHDERLLIPGQRELNIVANIELYLNDKLVDKISYDEDVTVTLDKGTAYNFVIALGNPGDEIKFTVTKVNDWAQADDVDAPAYPAVPQP